ncbi:MAG TPA: phytanoyl-CoA dioxygenase family protein [Tepidisphaeraceae bacterium]|jgi:ectoine hydroxylase-related dioxygenase (phytanoyl-CoA dioxygenase family)
MMKAAYRTVNEQDIADYRRDGYYVARGLIPAEEVAFIRDAFMDATKDGPIEGLSEMSHVKGERDPLARWPRIMQPHQHPEHPLGAITTRYLLDRRIGDILHDLLGEEAIAAQTMFYFKPPGARGQAPHQDNFYLKAQPGNCIAAWMAIDECDQENGAICVYPGSHKLDILCPGQADQDRFFAREQVDIPSDMPERLVRLSPGDVLFFEGNLVHGSHPNSSKDRFRRAFICHYANKSCSAVAGWYKPLLEFDGRETVRTANEQGGPCGTVEPAGLH